jgi:signal transduction histidine kinase
LQKEIILFGAGIYFYLQKSKTNKIILSQKEVLNELNATKDKLFSIISHDLRSSVSSLKTSNIKLLGYLESKNYEELDTLLHRNSILANSTYNLLDNLLNWSQQQTNQLYFEKESLHLYTVVEQVLFNYKPLLFEKNITLTANISKELYLYMDLDSLKIILRNIIDNAIKFSKSNGFISIYTEKRESQLVHLIVEDTGIGMDKETVAELTKDTQLLSRKENKEIIGTGLGLQLCKVMLQKNDGKLAMESKEGIGTKMILILPEYKNDASN